MNEKGLLDPRILRSVRIESDWFSVDPTEHYLLSPSSVEAIVKIATSAEGAFATRAFTLTGPFGTGKSAMALFLTDLLCGSESRQDRALNRLESATGKRQPARRFLPILATCTAAPIKSLIRDAIDASCTKFGLPVGLTFDELPKAAEAQGFDGVLVVLDELGKPLEYALSEPRLGDPYVLQELAEAANRSTPPMVVVGVLHQSFVGYAEGLDTTARNEWIKVQGRFSDIPYLPPEETLAKLVAESINGVPPALDEVARTAELVRGLPGIWPASMPLDRFVDLCAKSWPLHPVVVAAIPVLMRRFGQNERSLFAFLVERGLLTSHEQSRFVRLCDLFEHVSEWIGHGARTHGASRRWRVALELLHSRPGFDPDEREVLRTVAMLTALGRFAPFTSTTEAISLALGSDAKPALNRLESRSAIVHRRHLGAWLLWEGSDVDLDTLLEKSRVEVAGRSNLAKLLKDTGSMRAGIAQRHFEETGTLRWFSPVILTDPDHIKLPDQVDETNCILAISFGQTSSSQLKFEQWAQDLERDDVIVAVAHRAPNFRAMAEELEAITLVEASSHELRGDKVAREELASRRAALSSAMATEADRLLDPSGPNGCLFYYKGSRQSVTSRRDLTRLYSTVCDSRFVQAPRIRNELINRRALSSAAAAARRDLLERMLTRQSESRLGYVEGYPPDRAIYESVLLESGIHRQGSDGQWLFGAPRDADPCNLLPLWDHLAKILFGSFPEPITVARLIEQLSVPPFGAVEGPLPIIFLAFVMCHEKEVAIYREGSFVADPNIAHWELLLRRPELFAIAGCRQTGARQLALDDVCGRLGVDPPSLMPAVKFVIRAIDGLPPRAKLTQRISSRAKATRASALEARSPERFFFHDLPTALELEPLTEHDPANASEFVARLSQVLRELDGVVMSTRKWAAQILAREAGLEALPSGFAELMRLSTNIRDRLEDPKARELCSRLAIEDVESAETGALALVAMRPVESWTDQDCNLFEARAKALCGEIKEEVLRQLGTSAPKVNEQARQLASKLYTTITAFKDVDRQTMIESVRELLRNLEAK
ncbi:MAG: hypothetical protein ACOYON_05105 [Fimbriimonas sp.]